MKRLLSILLCGVLAMSFAGCSYSINLDPTANQGAVEATEEATKEATEEATEEVAEDVADEGSATLVTERSWDTEIVEHPGFRDLGEYIIELPDYDDPADLADAIEIVNAKYNQGELTPAGCTAMVTTDLDGDVIIGRNMDLEISQYPAFIYKTTFGKYKNFCVSYSPNGANTYAEVQQQDNIDEKWRKQLLFNASDCMNEKGLYIEVNMRTKNDALSNYGLHTSHGETTRDDGTPWSDLRVCTVAVPQLVSQNCATVEEAIEFLNNSYDWYTMSMPTIPTYDGWNMCFLIGDATGEYGVIEIAQDEVKFLPYQYGQANYYITPKWGILDKEGTGYGRLSRVSDVISSVTSLDEAMDAMKEIMWVNETLWLGYAERIEDGSRPNPYNQIVFQDDKGNTKVDWRTEYTQEWPVLDDGRMLVSAEIYQNAKDSTYDEKILQFYDEAIARGEAIVDDGSIKFDVNGEELTLTELEIKTYEFMSYYQEPEKQEELRPYYNALDHLYNNQNAYWCSDDHNFEAMQAAAYGRLHIRYDAEGNFDPTCMSKYEKLLAFYGYGTEKDETPLRDDAEIWTTGLNVGANCNDKMIKVRFFENDGLVYSARFE